jgi:hypothetical protein
MLAVSAFGESLKFRGRQSAFRWCFWQGYGFSCREDVFTFDFLKEK